MVIGGSGSFNGTETNEDPTYSPSNADYQAGQVSLTLIATTAGECEGIITETIFVTLYQAPVFSIDEDADNDGEYLFAQALRHQHKCLFKCISNQCFKSKLVRGSRW